MKKNTGYTVPRLLERYQVESKELWYENSNLSPLGSLSCLLYKLVVDSLLDHQPRQNLLWHVKKSSKIMLALGFFTLKTFVPILRAVSRHCCAHCACALYFVPGAGTAALSLVEEECEVRQLHRLLNVRVLQDYERALPTQLQRYTLQVAPPQHAVQSPSCWHFQYFLTQSPYL